MRKAENVNAILGILLTVTLLFYCGMVYAAENEQKPPQFESWIDHAADGFAGGAGTEDDPYLIATAEQLAYLAKTTNEGNDYKAKHFKLLRDIDLARYDWIAIGTQYDNLYKNGDAIFRKNPTFQGNFDGDNKVIRNLTTKNPCIESGLFGLLALGEVKNLVLININIQSCFLGGGIAAQAQFAKIKNCYISGSIEGFWCLGGVAGFSFSSEIVDSLINIKIHFNEQMPLEFELHRIKHYSFDSHTSLVNTGRAAGGVLGYVTNFFGPAWPSIINRCVVAWKICGGCEYLANAIAVGEGGTSLTIIDCTIVKDLTY